MKRICLLAMGSLLVFSVALFASGGKEEAAKTAEPQEFKFARRIVSSLRLTDLLEVEPLGWCGLTEVQVWGKDIYAPPSRLAAVYSP